MTNLIKTPDGLFKDGIFYFPVRIYYEDTDAGGIVYYANYLKFAERARTEFLRHVYTLQQHDALSEEEKCGFVVKKLDIDYKSSAVLDDLLTVSCKIVSAHGAVVDMKQEIRRNDELLADINITVVYVSLSKKRPIRIPGKLLEQMGATI